MITRSQKLKENLLADERYLNNSRIDMVANSKLNKNYCNSNKTKNTTEIHKHVCVSKRNSNSDLIKGQKSVKKHRSIEISSTEETTSTLSKSSIIVKIMESLKSEPPLTSPLIGRLDKLDVIAGFILKNANNTTSAILCISGSPGTGKTCCVDRVLRILSKGEWSYQLELTDGLVVNELTGNFKKVCEKSTRKEELKIPYTTLPKNYSIIRTNASHIIASYSNNSVPINLSLFLHLAILMKFSEKVIVEMKDIYKQEGLKECVKYFIAQVVSRRTKFIVFIDEIDLLNRNKGSDSVSELFKMTILSSTSQMILISISNTINIDRNISECMGILNVEGYDGAIDCNIDGRVKFMVFSPYDHNTLKEIVINRITQEISNIECEINNAGLELCVRKVASVYGDCRRTLDVCRLALSNYLMDIVELQQNEDVSADIDDEISSMSTVSNTPAQSPKPTRREISMSNFQDILNKVHASQSSKIQILQSLPLHQQYVIMSIILAIIDEHCNNMELREDEQNNNYTNMKSLLESLTCFEVSSFICKKKYYEICQRFLTPPEDFKDMLDAIESHNIIKLSHSLVPSLNISSLNGYKRRQIKKINSDISNIMIKLQFTPEQVINSLTSLEKVGVVFSKLLPL
ncbi:hypothetical protein cand_030420 [Cryptosporidium andersoni]|uniref:Uncharacterized protein n=1 Tax=Cryptosporidium andersoni TaxID=117008 RepID=A0A1J4MSC6_9CRYT|nr:hypothetical protein cand_030420 [Cryptosporidium andersoni]